jgi:SAM-dependent methyltransferase
MDPKSILSIPAAYRVFQRLIRGNARRDYVNQYIMPSAGDRVLDIGCGPGDILDDLPEIDYLGIDISRPYIEAAKSRFGQRGRFLCIPLKELVVEEPESFDIVMANGVVHHLDDEEALELYRLARVALRSTGRLITRDPCFQEGQSRVARFLISNDRGEHVRHSEEYRALAAQVFPKVTLTVRHDMTRVPYTHAILECRS